MPASAGKTMKTLSQRWICCLNSWNSATQITLQSVNIRNLRWRPEMQTQLQQRRDIRDLRQLKQAAADIQTNSRPAAF